MSQGCEYQIYDTKKGTETGMLPKKDTQGHWIKKSGEEQLENFPFFEFWYTAFY